MLSESHKIKYETNIEYREQLKAKNLDRYHNDPIYRESVKRKARERYLKLKQEKNKISE